MIVDAPNDVQAGLDPELQERMLCAHTLVGERQVVLSVQRTIMWVNAYSIDRVYGGPEEGGWWQDVYECIASAPVQNVEEADMVGEIMRRALAWENPRSRYSVIGGPDYSQRVQEERAQSETTELMRYE